MPAFPQIGSLVHPGSRPDAPARLRSTYGQSVSLLEENLPEAEEWEPSSGSPAMTVDEIEDAIQKWEDELRSRGREISGRTM